MQKLKSLLIWLCFWLVLSIVLQDARVEKIGGLIAGLPAVHFLAIEVFAIGTGMLIAADRRSFSVGFLLTFLIGFLAANAFGFLILFQAAGLVAEKLVALR